MQGRLAVGRGRELWQWLWKFQCHWQWLEGRGKYPSGYKIKVHDLQRWPMLSIPEVRERIASGLSDMGSSWAMAHCVDVNVNYTAASGVGCDLSMVGVSEVFN